MINTTNLNRKYEDVKNFVSTTKHINQSKPFFKKNCLYWLSKIKLCNIVLAKVIT